MGGGIRVAVLRTSLRRKGFYEANFSVRALCDRVRGRAHDNRHLPTGYGAASGGGSRRGVACLAVQSPWTANGTRQPARWFCDACGNSWPAIFERDQQPVRRFEGYDESKAAGAARRADELFRRQHQLAIRRAGAAERPAEPKRRPRRPAAQVVALDNMRRIAK
jgi:hypothetical protein